MFAGGGGVAKQGGTAERQADSLAHSPTAPVAESVPMPFPVLHLQVTRLQRLYCTSLLVMGSQRRLRHGSMHGLYPTSPRRPPELICGGEREGRLAGRSCPRLHHRDDVITRKYPTTGKPCCGRGKVLQDLVLQLFQCPSMYGHAGIHVCLQRAQCAMAGVCSGQDPSPCQGNPGPLLIQG